MELVVYKPLYGGVCNCKHYHDTCNIRIDHGIANGS